MESIHQRNIFISIEDFCAGIGVDTMALNNWKREVRNLLGPEVAAKLDLSEFSIAEKITWVERKLIAALGANECLREKLHRAEEKSQDEGNRRLVNNFALFAKEG